MEKLSPPRAEAKSAPSRADWLCPVRFSNPILSTGYASANSVTLSKRRGVRASELGAKWNAYTSGLARSATNKKCVVGSKMVSWISSESSCVSSRIVTVW